MTNPAQVAVLTRNQMTTCSTSPESDIHIQPATPQLGWMTAGFPGFAEDTLFTFGNPAGDSFSPGLAYPGLEPWSYSS